MDPVETIQKKKKNDHFLRFIACQLVQELLNLFHWIYVIIVSRLLGCITRTSSNIV